jgi:hypothetical protein
VKTHEFLDAGPKFWIVGFIHLAFPICVLTAVLAIGLSIYLWRTSSRAVRIQISSWFVVALVAVGAELSLANLGLSFTVLPQRIVIGWLHLAFQTVLFGLPLVWLVSPATPTSSTN